MLSVQIQKKLAQFTLDITFCVKDEIVVLFGPSGSGKTTALNIIAGLLHPDKGSVLLNNMVFFSEEAGGLPPQKRKVGYLFQDYALFPHMTVRKNIRYGIRQPLTVKEENQIQHLLEGLGIGHLLLKYPHQISGGEKQRVALARALACEPALLLLDEPLSALDHASRLRGQDELLRLHKEWKIPTILVTHDKEEARKLGDRILYMEAGKIHSEEQLIPAT
ncbi:ABC transporter ATP-binding protein [Aneurinibacillus tyrosinisolvens]|uniref:ABC transporter ATP-binding protein n=1 Tax=Aneurinibacillus tyrosinisolvens TaxID=1443435 RepID=UPI00063F9C51|nr:ATP-binding cassette domain-containing protein [Aneurinibacillus tyrosinisolvens]